MPVMRVPSDCHCRLSAYSVANDVSGSSEVLGRLEMWLYDRSLSPMNNIATLTSAIIMTAQNRL